MALSLLRTLALSLVLAATLAVAPALATTGGAAAPTGDSSTAGGAGYGTAVTVPAGATSAPSGGANPADPKLVAQANARARAKARAKAKARARAKARAKARARALARARAKARAEAKRLAQIKNSAGYVFPLAGPYTTSPGGQFGAPRPGHVHQGQDLSAADGTPVLAPHAGTVSTVAYQAGGAGNYVVLHSTDGRDYVFMHLRTGSVLVKSGDTLRAGQKIGEVGSTGESSGPHLHFEVWVGGPWQMGGHPIDPMPLLLSWRR
jgi:murein DD-endopeptidase MepM/ murein hydrolase activator NlpD